MIDPWRVLVFYETFFLRHVRLGSVSWCVCALEGSQASVVLRVEPLSKLWALLTFIRLTRKKLPKHEHLVIVTTKKTLIVFTADDIS